jgi:hypothetical protein
VPKPALRTEHVAPQTCAGVVARACLNRRCVQSTLLRRYVQAWWRA